MVDGFRLELEEELEEQGGQIRVYEEVVAGYQILLISSMPLVVGSGGGGT